jgi:DNA-binding protein HU-beta
MTKSELIDAIAATAGITKADAGKALGAFTDTIGTTLASGDKVSIPGFGTFKPSPRAARTAKNPQTGAPVNVPAHVAATFKAGKGLKAAVNG